VKSTVGYVRTSKQLNSNLVRRDQVCDSCVCSTTCPGLLSALQVGTQKKRENGIGARKKNEMNLHEHLRLCRIKIGLKVVGAQFAKRVRWFDFSENPRCEKEGKDS